MADHRYDDLDIPDSLFGRRYKHSRYFSRLGAWAVGAGLAVVLVLAAALSETGTRRIAGVFAEAPPAPPQLAPRMPDQAAEIRRINDALRALAADRDRLAVRLTALERTLDDSTVTGSIPRDPAGGLGAQGRAAPLPAGSLLAPARPPTPGAPSAAIPAEETLPEARSTGVPTQPAPAQIAKPQSPPLGPRAGASVVPAEAPAKTGAASDAQGRIASGHAATAQPPETVVTRTDFGIDVGGDQSVEGLRSLWAALRGNHAALFEGLRPVIAIREGQKPGTMELRLVAGPLANASIAARYCAALSVSGIHCQPAVFDGQRLALR